LPIATGSVRASVAATSRVPVVTSWPRAASLPAIAWPTMPVPSTAILIVVLLAVSAWKAGSRLMRRRRAGAAAARLITKVPGGRRFVAGVAGQAAGAAGWR
jgi:hypothetical protein